MKRGYNEIDEGILRRIARIEHGLDDGFNTAPPVHDPELRQRLESLSDVASDALSQALSDVRRAEKRIADARRAGLTGRDIVEVKRAAGEELLRRTERRRLTELKDIFAGIAALEKRHLKSRDSDPVRSLLSLERAKLRHGGLSEREAVTRIGILRSKGRYDEADTQVLASHGQKARAAAEELRRELPVFVANEEGAMLLERAEAMLDTVSGDVSFTVNGSPAPQTINVLPLLNGDVRPSPSEFTRID